MAPPRKRKKIETRSIAEIIAEKEKKIKNQMTPRQEVQGIEQQLSEDEQDTPTVVLPRFLSEIQDIRPLEYCSATGHGININYTCSTLSRVFVRAHSNFDDVLKKFVKAQREKFPNTNKPRADYAGTLMRRLVSVPRYRYEKIYSDFIFDTATNYALTLELLKFSKINSFEDMREFEIFNKQAGIVPCSVNVDPHVDPIANDGMEYMKWKAAGKVDQHWPQRHHDFILQQYYVRENLIIHIRMCDLTYEKLCEISNFEEEMDLQVEIDNIPEECRAEYVEDWIDKIQNHRDIMHKHFKVFRVNPRYILIKGNISASQQSIITKDINTFYRKSNAKKILQTVGGWHYTKESLFKLYLSRSAEERDLYPFHDHIYYMDETIEKPLSPVKRPPARKRVAYREETTSPIASTSKSMPPPTVISSVPEKPDVDWTMVVPPDIDKFLEVIIKNLLTDEKFVERVRDYFINKFNPKGFDLSLLWQESCEFIVMNVIARNLRSGESKDLEMLIEMCEGIDEEENTIKVFKLYTETVEYDPYNFDAEEEQNEAENVEPANNSNAQQSPNVTILEVVTVLSPKSRTTTSAIINDVPSPEQGSSDVVICDSPTKSPNVKNSLNQSNSSCKTVIEIKKEKLSPQFCVNDSEIQCLGTLPDVVVNLDESSQIIPPRLSETFSEQNEVLKMFEEGSQTPEKSNPSPKSTRSRSSLNSKSPQSSANDTFKQLEPRVLRYAQKRTAPGPLSSKTSAPKRSRNVNKKQPAKQIEYIDEDSQESLPPANGNSNAIPPNEVVSNANDDELSIFLSSQLIEYDPPRQSNSQTHITDPNPFTFAPQTASTPSSSSHCNNLKTSFHAQIKGVKFVVDERFEITVTVRQFNLYELVIADDQSIQNFFNINENCFQSLKNLLITLGKYEYHSEQKQQVRKRGRKSKADSLKSTVDHFFETFHNFDISHFQLDGHQIEVSHEPPDNRNKTDLTEAIGHETLERMLRHKPRS